MGAKCPIPAVMLFRTQIPEVVQSVITKKRDFLEAFFCLWIFILLASCPLRAQTEKTLTGPLTLEDAVRLAVKNYPMMRAASEGVSAARAGVRLARTNYLPRADLLWQSNRATRNNIFGLLLPQSVIPSISGPVLPDTLSQAVWGSAAGALISWEPLDFGLRRAQVDAARRAQDRATAQASFTELEVATEAADAFLGLLAAQERTRAARANLERAVVLARSTHVLAENELRPGADASRADAEVAAARILLVRVQEAEQVSRAVFGQALGAPGTDTKIEPSPLLDVPPQAPSFQAAAVSHPLAEIQRASIEEERAKVKALERSYFPRFNFQTALSGRGSGANTDGTFAGGANGLGLERANWAVGMTVTFPLFDFAAIRARREIEASNERAQEALYDRAQQELAAGLEKARAAWEGARQVAENTPVELKAARDAEAQARVRYQAGLGTIVEVAEAQRLLVQAEIDDAVARLTLWRALLAAAAAEGNVQKFLDAVRSASQGGH